MSSMNLHLDDVQADELRLVLDGALGDLSHEIADTDNASFRDRLRARREHLRAIRAQLGDS